MGVLHMAIPTTSRITGHNPPARRLPRVAAPHVVQSPARTFPSSLLLQQINPTPAPRGTLLPPTKSLEAKLERNPEQEAAQEALAKLVRQCMAGDSQAWQQLVASQHRRIYAICYRFTGSGSDAEDLTQEVFLKLYKNLASFDTQKGSFQTWITTLARNLLVDHFRRTRLERASESLDATFDGEEDGPTMGDRLADTRPSQEHHVAGLELKARVQNALKQLSPELREAVILRDLEDMDYKEISQVLRIPEGTVKSRISRGRGELARLLQRIES
ncbi:RNA polymerase sigma factor [Granulicella sp. S190]|uniref:RNA polymerase sigma factor n=1 Tax=Granulicella sp. S190 TaxID=1747226 RepID=UPI00131BE213|nr:RNA polymerase sigma factor [Granulicella sp. S190]